MALDTRDKRSSAISPGSPWRGMLPLADGAITLPDWQHVALAYSGIAVQSAVNLISAPTIEAFTVAATAVIPVVATSTATIEAFTTGSGSDALATVTVQATSTVNIAAFTSTGAEIFVGTVVLATPTIGDFTSTATGAVTVTAQVNATIGAFVGEAFIAGSSFGKYTIRGRGSGVHITCRPNMSTVQDVSFHYTEDWTWTLLRKDGDGTPIDISGSALRFRLATIDGTTVMTRTESDGFTVTDGTGGECILRVTPAHQTNAGVAPATRYVWEFRVTTAGNIVMTQAYGHLTVLPSLLSS